MPSNYDLKHDIGAKYEMYVGERYENSGYTVAYIGRMFGVEDHGIDLIAKNEAEIWVIQCKYRSDGWWVDNECIRKFSEDLNQIKNLYNECMHKKSREIKASMITNTSFAPIGKSFAKEKNIILQSIPMQSDYQSSCKFGVPNASFEEYVKTLIADGEPYGKSETQKSAGQDYMELNKQEQVFEREKPSVSKMLIVAAVTIMLILAGLKLYDYVSLTPEGKCYIAPFSGKRYHTYKNCKGLRKAKEIELIDIDQACEQSMLLCGYCEEKG